MKQKWLAMLCAFALLITILPVSQAAEAPVEPPAETPVGDESNAPSLPERGLDLDQGLDLSSPEPDSSPAPDPTASATPSPEVTAAAQTEQKDRTVLVGLAYGSSGLPGANLQNSVGKGYRFGFLDEDRVFHGLGFTEEINISVAITQNVWYGDDDGYTSYSDKIKTDIMVGCWHVQHPIQVTNFTEAAQAAAQIPGGFPAWVEGVWSVRSGSYATRAEATAAAEAVGGTLGETGSYGVSVIKRGTSQILFQFDGGADMDLTVLPGLDDTQKNVTWFKYLRYYGAFQFHRHNGGNVMTVVNVVALDDYAECVASREMSSSWPLEALKAQVVCARSYCQVTAALRKHKSYGFDICSTTDCQVYYGMGSTNANTAQAVAETTGLMAWYDGKVASTYYCSSNGGASEDVRNIWSSSANMPYLCGVIDPYEAYVADKISNYYWTREFTSSELTERLRSKGYDTGNIVDCVTTLSPTGNVKSITFIDENGKSWPFTKTNVVSFLGAPYLRSYRYSVTAVGEVIGGVYYTQDGSTVETVQDLYAVNSEGEVEKISSPTYVITGSGEVEALPAPYGGTATGEIKFTVKGSGWGHNIGMSQWGAYSMATQGYNFIDILTFYYPGVEIY